MKKIVLVALVALGFAGASEAHAAEKVGTVNMQLAIQSVDAGKEARKELEKAFNEKKSELKKEEARIKKMHQELQKQSLVLNEKALAKKQMEMQQKVMKLQEKTAQSQAEIQKREQELTRPIVERIKSIIGKLAKEKGYTVILEKNENNVLYSQEQDDLTEEVIKRFNNKG